MVAGAYNILMLSPSLPHFGTAWERKAGANRSRIYFPSYSVQSLALEHISCFLGDCRKGEQMNCKKLSLAGLEAFLMKINTNTVNAKGV